MTVTSVPAELEAAAAREAALGNHAYAAALYQEANENQSLALTAGVITHKATIATSLVTEKVASHVRKVKGEDGAVHVNGPVT